MGLDTFRLISLEAAVLVQRAALREDVAIVVSTGLIMAATGVGRPKTEDLATGLVGDHDVLLGVPLLLAAVVLPASLAVLGTPDRPLRAIDEKRQARTCPQHLLEGSRLAGRQLKFVAQGPIDDRSQAMDPLASLSLTEAEEKGQGLLGGVLPEVEQQEDQFVRRGGQDSFGSPTGTAVAWCGAPSFPLLAIVLVGTLEVRQEGLEGGQSQAGQLLEDSGPSADLLEVQHASAPRSRRKGRAYPRDDLFPIKSNT